MAMKALLRTAMALATRARITLRCVEARGKVPEGSFRQPAARMPRGGERHRFSFGVGMYFATYASWARGLFGLCTFWSGRVLQHHV